MNWKFWEIIKKAKSEPVLRRTYTLEKRRQNRYTGAYTTERREHHTYPRLWVGEEYLFRLRMEGWDVVERKEEWVYL